MTVSKANPCVCGCSARQAAWPRAAAPYGVPVLSAGGFDSLTAKHDLARELARSDAPCEVLHIGDLDPSGVHLFSALAEDVGAMVRGLGGGTPAFTRLAVTRAQADAMALPTAPPKPTDRRSFTGNIVQAEAIPPDELSAMVNNAIMARQDAGIRAGVLAREAEARDDLIARFDGDAA